jgi:nucleolar protein 12
LEDRIKDRAKGSKAKKRKVEPPALSESDEENGQLEDAYLSRRPSGSKAVETNIDIASPSEASDDDGDEADTSRLVHESVANAEAQNAKSSRSRKTHNSPPDETSEQRDKRTIFVGNVPAEVAKSRVCDVQCFTQVTRF